MKRVTILGSTGSIGTQALDVISSHPDQFTVVGLSANSSVSQLEEQCRIFAPQYACMMDETAAKELRTALADTDIQV